MAVVVQQVMPSLLSVTVGSEQKQQRDMASRNKLWRRWGRPWSLARCEWRRQENGSLAATRLGLQLRDRDE